MASQHHETNTNGDKLTTMNSNNGGNDLSRQVTYSLSQEQYERLFFQPSQAKGDLAKRLGNPTLLGLCGFLIPFTTTMFSVMQWRGANSSSLTGFSGCFYFVSCASTSPGLESSDHG